MKGYQFYVVKDFPPFEQGQTLNNQVQTTILGEFEDVNTSITFTQKNMNGCFDRYSISTKVKYNDLIYVKTVQQGRRFELTLTEYLKPKDFSAYYDASQRTMFFQTSRKVARSVVPSLRTTEY